MLSTGLATINHKPCNISPSPPSIIGRADVEIILCENRRIMIQDLVVYVPEIGNKTVTEKFCYNKVCDQWVLIAAHKSQLNDFFPGSFLKNVQAMLRTCLTPLLRTKNHGATTSPWKRKKNLTIWSSPPFPLGWGNFHKRKPREMWWRQFFDTEKGSCLWTF